MARIALIQNQFSVLNAAHAGKLSGFSKQMYQKFYEVLVEESGHEVQTAQTLKDYQFKFQDTPDIVICCPLPESGNLAPGLAELGRIREAFGPAMPVIVWTTRTEEAIHQTVQDDYGVVACYTGNLIEAPDDFADMVLQFTG